MTLRNALVAGVAAAGSVAAPLTAGPIKSNPSASQIFATAAASAPCGVDPRDLFGIQQVESGSAVLQPDGRATWPDGSPIIGDKGQSFGPYQFYTPAGTWGEYGGGGDVNSLADSAAATARMLCADNYASDRHAAIAAHNGSGPAAQVYADRVIAIADGTNPGVFPTGQPVPLHDGVAAGKATVSTIDRYRGSAGRLLDTLVGSLVDGFHQLVGHVSDPKARPILEQVDARASQVVAPGAAVAPSPTTTTTTEPFPLTFPRGGM